MEYRAYQKGFEFRRSRQITSLYRSVIGGYIFRGYREGLGAFEHVKN